ncbi:DEAD/DEAH box helicase, partial [bacterium]|nr:DEAD/DEAH box helicase [bacterium]
MLNHELNAVVMPDHSLLLEWLPGVSGGRGASGFLDEIYSHYSSAENLYWLFYLGFCNQKVSVSASLGFWRKFSYSFVGKLKLIPDLEGLRDRVVVELLEDEALQFLASAPLMPGREYLQKELLFELWQELNDIFSEKISSFSGSVADFVKKLSPEIHLAGRIYFHLVENKNHVEPFAFMATYSTRLDDTGESRHLPLKYALKEYEDEPEKLLQLLVTVDDTAQQSELVLGLRESGELFQPLAWSTKEAFTFFKEIPLYEEAGIVCRIPNWWKGKAARVSLQLNLGEKEPSRVGIESLLDFNPKLMVGDTEISVAEARRLLEEAEGLAFLKNKWVTVDPERLEKTLAAYDDACALNREEGISMLEAMRLSLNPQKMVGDDELEIVSGVSHGEWLKSVFSNLNRPDRLGSVKTSKAFKAKLRHYQQDGLKWLFYLHKLNLGACLADDMGLGKTLQVLAFLNAMKMDEKCLSKRSQKSSLLIIPASLLGNWNSEIEKFYPELASFTAHPGFHDSKKVPEPTPEELDEFDLVITTYALVQRYQWLSDYSWNYVILDEAQAIKNPGTKQTRVVKELKSKNRIVMTGTPIENRLSDLWSLFDFLNPGLLGNAKEFNDLSKKLLDKPEGYAELRRVVNPFILRRLKSDKAIIADLPDKIEVKTWAAMSKKQIILYKEILASVANTIENAEGIGRRGIVLAALMKFKQLCNHPDQYLGANSFSEKESGKFQRLREICETIYEKREKVLVFTQFKEMTEPLSRFLATIFKKEGLILHGSVAVAKRKELVEKFQGREYIPYFILSLKAGGVGLNLTEANHVIHFDRWW